MIGAMIGKYAVAAIVCIQAAAVSATETITYTYDAVGRLVATAHSGTVNNGLSSGYQYDAADNRTQVAVAGSPLGRTTARGGTTENQPEASRTPK